MIVDRYELSFKIQTKVSHLQYVIRIEAVAYCTLANLWCEQFAVIFEHLHNYLYYIFKLIFTCICEPVVKNNFINVLHHQHILT